ncbi:MAG: diguanylate cyclase domain-containing protein [Gammaproteobacteria bacterium]
MAILRTEAVQAHDREIDRLESVAASGYRLLRFPGDLEREFAADFSLRYLDYRRRVALLTLLAIIAAGIFDVLLVHGELDSALLLRYGLVTPLVLAVVAFSRSRWFPGLQQASLSLLTLLIAGLLFGLMRLGDQTLVLAYSPGFLLVAVFAGMLLHLRFWLALFLVLAVGVAYVTFLAYWRPQPTEIVVVYTIFYATASTMALFAGYGIEHAARRQFLQSRLLALKQNELELANRQLQELVDQDGLTGIANRRHFEAHLAGEWSRALRGGYPLSLLMIDLDYFKKYNDTYGHQAGDDCLIVVGSVLRAHSQRSGDVAARYGGEEFAMILPATGREDAEELGWRIVRDIVAYRIPHKASPVSAVMTASIGVATVVPSPLLTARDLVAAADEALYLAKANGRNRVEVAADVTVAAADATD